MQLSEKEIEDFMFEDLTENSGFSLARKGFRSWQYDFIDIDVYCNTRWLRQVELGPYGRADIIGYFRLHGTIHVNIIELKAVPIKSEDFEQICRYKQAIKHYFGDRFDLKFQLHLVGQELESGHYIQNELNCLVSTYSYDLNGIRFSTHKGTWSRPDASSFNFIKSLHHAEEVHGYR